MYSTEDISDIAQSLNLTTDYFNFLSALSGILVGFTLMFLILYIISLSNIKG